MVWSSSSTRPPSLALALDEMDLVAHVAEGGGGGHAGDAAADHDGGVRERHVDLVERLEHARPGDATCGSGPWPCRWPSPGWSRCTQLAWSRMLAISKRNGLRPGLAQGVLEDRLVGARRAARHHDAVEVVLGDHVLDEREAVGRARVHGVVGVDHAGQLERRTRRRPRRRSRRRCCSRSGRRRRRRAAPRRPRRARPGTPCRR